MMHRPDPHAALKAIVPHPAPNEPVARAILIAFRRLAIGGLSDAHAVNILIGDFGIAYHRPLMFLRVFVAELSRVAKRQIHVAPCCCPRMTHGETAILTTINTARQAPEKARATLARLTASLDCLPALSVAQSLADALDDIGRPLVMTHGGDFLD